MRYRVLVEGPGDVAFVKKVFKELNLPERNYMIIKVAENGGFEKHVRDEAVHYCEMLEKGVSTTLIILGDSDARDEGNYRNKLLGCAYKEGIGKKNVHCFLAVRMLEAWFLGDANAMKCSRLGNRSANDVERLVKHYQSKPEKRCGSKRNFLCILDKKKSHYKRQQAGHMVRKMDFSRNTSPSFQKFLNGMKTIVGAAEE